MLSSFQAGSGLWFITGVLGTQNLGRYQFYIFTDNFQLRASIIFVNVALELDSTDLKELLDIVIKILRPEAFYSSCTAASFFTL